MLLIVGTVRLPPENLPQARTAMRAMVDQSRSEEGCMEYIYAEDLFDPGLIHVKELWRDQAALDAHFVSEHIATWRSQWAIFDIGHRQLVKYAVGDAQPT